MQIDVHQIKDRVAEQSEAIHRLQAELSKTIVGQEEMISRLLVGLLTNGHILLEGVPGLAKTTAIKSLAQALATEFQRIQFTPDLLPADLVGHDDLRARRSGLPHPQRARSSPTSSWPTKSTAPRRRCSRPCWRRCRSGRSPSATAPIRSEGLFLVMATQNPIEQEGTYPLPEAQVDRFMLKVKITYPEAGRGAEDARHGAGRHGPARSSRCSRPRTSSPCRRSSR